MFHLFRLQSSELKNTNSNIQKVDKTLYYLTMIQAKYCTLEHTFFGLWKNCAQLSTPLVRTHAVLLAGLV